MDVEYQKRLEKHFQPGFSTKKAGWGLGLSLSSRIIKISTVGN